MKTIVNATPPPPNHGVAFPLAEEILPHYTINEHTLALIPVRHIDYQTIAYEGNQKLYIKKTPFIIIEKGCLDHFHTIEGIRTVIHHHTGWKRKVPIPISIHRNIVAFPTHAWKDFACCWIFYHQVRTIVEDMRSRQQSIILFQNGRQLLLDAPVWELRKQLERVGYLLERIDRY